MAAAWVAGVPGVAGAMTADGALITNVAFATFQGTAGTFTANWQMSYAASANVLVACPTIVPLKFASPSVQAVGGAVTFTICAVNTAILTSAINVTLTDALPVAMGYVNPSYASWAPAGSTWFNTHSGNGTTWGAGEPPNGQVSPWYLRFVVNVLGPGKSACVSYRMTVL